MASYHRIQSSLARCQSAWDNMEPEDGPEDDTDDYEDDTGEDDERDEALEWGGVDK